MKLIFDIETNGLLDDVSTLHCITMIDLATGQKYIATDNPYTPAADLDLMPLSMGLTYLHEAELLIGHNVLAYDIPVLKKLYADLAITALIRDTMTCARLIWPKDNLRTRDFERHRKNLMPGNLIGAYSLQSWGYRLLEYKGDYDGEWHTFNQEMGDYAIQDVIVTLKLWEAIGRAAWPEQSIELEHEVAKIIVRQQRHGFLFDEEKARVLTGKLTKRKHELETELQEVFPPWTIETVFTPKANNSKMGYVKGEPFTKRKQVTFNPGSRIHIADRLKVQRGWKPTEFTNDGQAKIDETVLAALEWPEAKLLSEYFMVDKRLGQCATGKEAWLKKVGKDGRIHGSVNTNGAVTGRMTHSHPNMAQVPGNGAPYGHECRELFTVPQGKVLVGADAAALELRCLAGYMARFDEGAYVATVLEGKSEDQTDIHNVNARALGCTRAQAKVWFYAFIYGAGDAKLGTILEAPGGKEVAWGKQSRARFLMNLPALGKVTQRVKDIVEGKTNRPKHLNGLDGRRLVCRSAHSAFNTLLQSAGAVIMKQALVILDRNLQASGLVPGVDYEFTGNIHDEWQIEVSEAHGETVGRTAKDSIRLAGEHFNFGCPLDGDFKVGRTWAETH